MHIWVPVRIRVVQNSEGLYCTLCIQAINYSLLFLQFACCGLDSYKDYEVVYNRSFVPHSCCDTSNPLFNSTTCPENGTDAQAAYQSGLLYDNVGDTYIHDYF